jgi:hypothetical protein
MRKYFNTEEDDYIHHFAHVREVNLTKECYMHCDCGGRSLMLTPLGCPSRNYTVPWQLNEPFSLFTDACRWERAETGSTSDHSSFVGQAPT